MSERTVAIGVDKLYLAKMTSPDTTDGVPAYDDPKHFAGVRQVNITIRSNQTPWYDDNQLFKVLDTIEGADMSIEKSMLSDEEYAYITEQDITDDGEIEDNLRTSIPYFAVMYRRKLDGETTDGRERYRYVTVYKWKPKRPDEATQTKQNTATPQPDTITGTVMPLESRPGHWRRFGDNANDGFSSQKEEEYFTAVKLPA